MIRPRFIRFDNVESTNDIALELARRGEPEGIVVTAASQSHGRGRRGRTWIDEPGTAVLMSVILRPEGGVAFCGHQGFVAALAVEECLRDICALDTLLKWPNDVMVGSRKIAGILVETCQSDEGDGIVVGIGLNVNQVAFPPELADAATSILLETGRRWEIAPLTEKLAEYELSLYEAYRAQGFDEILNAWRRHMWGTGCRVRISAQRQTVVGKIAGVDRDGALILRGANSGEHRFVAADCIRLESDSDS